MMLSTLTDAALRRIDYIIGTELENISGARDDIRRLQEVRATGREARITMDTASMLASDSVIRLWRQQSRTAVSVSPELLSHIDTGTSIIDPAVFRQLPLVNPLIVFPEPIPTTTIDNIPALIHGFFVYGGERADVSMYTVTTTDDREHMVAIGVMMLCEVNDPADPTPPHAFLYEIRRHDVPHRHRPDTGGRHRRTSGGQLLVGQVHGDDGNQAGNVGRPVSGRVVHPVVPRVRTAGPRTGPGVTGRT